ncbi:MAG: hypothetical protein WBB19_01140 [Desulforhopalus sp.]
MGKDQKDNKEIPKLPEILMPYDSVELPSCAQAKHIGPNVCFQSALFGMVGRGKRKFLNGQKIVSFRGLTISYTGEQLDQGDLDVFIHAVHLTALEKENRRPDGLVQFTVRSFLSAIGRKPGKSGQQWLLNSIRRLSASNVEIRFDGSQPYSTYSVYGGSLINDYFYDPRLQRYYLRVNCNLGALFDLGWTRLCWQQRLQLSGNLTRWLHGLYSSTKAYPIKVSSLLILSGSGCSRLSDFRRQLKNSLIELVDIGVLMSWKIDSEDKVHVILEQKND